MWFPWFFIITDLPCVILQSRISQFWRHQNGSPRWYLATIEAIHQFLVEFHTAIWNSKSDNLQCISTNTDLPLEHSTCETKTEGNVTNSSEKDYTCDSANDISCPYNGEYDNLLFFFRYMYSKIHTLYDHEDLKAYKRPLT